MFFFSGVAYGATCTGTGAGECGEANNICVAGTSKCACATTSFRKGGTECAKSKNYLLIYVVSLIFVPGRLHVTFKHINVVYHNIKIYEDYYSLKDHYEKNRNLRYINCIF